jgi:hypothetical protein
MNKYFYQKVEDWCYANFYKTFLAYSRLGQVKAIACLFIGKVN